jgi:hypothetical protein
MDLSRGALLMLEDLPKDAQVNGQEKAHGDGNHQDKDARANLEPAPRERHQQRQRCECDDADILRGEA